ncbi:MAG: hypothetical protein WCZ72_08765 [Gemmobacter sp.]
MRKLKVLAVLVLAGLIGLAGYAYFGDMRPETRQIEIPVPLDGG